MGQGEQAVCARESRDGTRHGRDCARESRRTGYWAIGERQRTGERNERIRKERKKLSMDQ